MDEACDLRNQLILGRVKRPWQRASTDSRGPHVISVRLWLHLLGADVSSRPLLRIAFLLQPKAHRRAVQEPKQRVVISVRGVGVQLDDDRALLEDPSACIESEVVMRSDPRENDRKGGTKFLRSQPAVLIPPKSTLDFRLAPEHLVVGQARASKPEIPERVVKQVVVDGLE